MFVGFPLPDHLKRLLSSTVRDLRHTQPAWRDEKWVAEENLHLTLVFLGDACEPNAPHLAAALAEVSQRHDVFSLPIDGLRAVPSARRCRMIWAAFLDPNNACAQLAADIEAAARLPEDETPEGRSFRAHATLCRARRARRLDSETLTAISRQLTQDEPPMSVPSFTLFDSRLTPRGPVYTQRGTWHLRGA